MSKMVISPYIPRVDAKLVSAVPTEQEYEEQRKDQGLKPATYNYSDPGPNMHGDPMWEAIWDEIKTWDINVPTEYSGYTSGCGNHVTAIFKAIHNRFAEQETNGA